jgi:hypothetical protein
MHIPETEENRRLPMKALPKVRECGYDSGQQQTE